MAYPYGRPPPAMPRPSAIGCNSAGWPWGSPASPWHSRPACPPSSSYGLSRRCSTGPTRIASRPSLRPWAARRPGSVGVRRREAQMPNATRALRYGSLCSGIEAASVAFAPLGWEPAFFAEIEPFCCAVLQHHYPTVPNLGDFTTITTGNGHGTIDLCIAGTPCQSFSIAGRRAGLADPRGNLTLEYLALVDRLRPSWMSAAERPRSPV